ncbi:MAG: thiolase, partial [Chloroflexi bacterium]|nr:thiolase [Chloroflexota bacterium]
MTDKYAIVGVGQTRLGDLPGVSKLGIVSEAMRNAILDAGLTNKDVDGIMSHSDSVYTHHTRVGELLGINPRFAETITSGGASQIKQLIWACLAIEHGLAEVVVCGYGETERH